MPIDLTVAMLTDRHSANPYHISEIEFKRKVYISGALLYSSKTKRFFDNLAAYFCITETHQFTSVCYDDLRYLQSIPEHCPATRHRFFTDCPLTVSLNTTFNLCGEAASLNDVHFKQCRRRSAVNCSGSRLDR
jgi:hypothetical protein